MSSASAYLEQGSKPSAAQFLEGSQGAKPSASRFLNSDNPTTTSSPSSSSGNHEGLFLQAVDNLENAFPSLTGSKTQAGRWLKGGVEAGASLGSSVLALPIAGLAGIGDEVLKKAGLTNANPSDVVNSTSKALTYEPKTSEGKRASKVLNLPFEVLAKGADAAADYAFQKTGSPVVAAGVKTAIQGGPALLGLRGLKGEVGEVKGVSQGETTVKAESAPRPGASEAESAPADSTTNAPPPEATPVEAVSSPKPKDIRDYLKPSSEPFTSQQRVLKYVEVSQKPPVLRTSADNAFLKNAKLTKDEQNVADILQKQPSQLSATDKITLRGFLQDEHGVPLGNATDRALASLDRQTKQLPETPKVAGTPKAETAPSAKAYLGPSTKVSANPMFDASVHKDTLGPAYERLRGAARQTEERSGLPPELGKERLPVPTDDIEHALHVIRNQKTLDSLDALAFIKKARDAGMTAEDNRAFMDYIEQAHLPKDQRTVELTPRQHELFNRFVKPVRDSLDHSEGYVPREAIGKGGKLDRIARREQGGFGVPTLRKSLPSMKHRVFKALTDEQGNRKVVAVKREGKALKLTAFNQGKAEPFGRITRTTAEEDRAKELMPLNDELAKLRREKAILSATKSRRDAAKIRLRNIDAAIDRVHARRAQLEDDLSTLNGTYYKRKGSRYQIGEATANEVERHTNVRYHRNLMGKLLDEYVGNRQVERQTQFLDDLKASPKFHEIATQETGRAPSNWRPVNLPQFHGYVMEPYTAEVLNNYARKMRGDNRVPYLSAANDLLRKAMFSVLPVWHDFNLADIAIINRGLAGNFAPKGIIRLWKTLAPATKEVMTLGPKYQRLMEKGAPFMYAKSQLGLVTPEAYADIVESIGKELDAKAELHPIAKALGFVPGKAWQAMKWWGRHAQTSMWAFNDVGIMQGIMERERMGMSEDQALARTMEVLPNYQLPEGSRLLNIVTHPDVSWFARYHIGLFRAYGKMMKRLLGRHQKLADRAKAADQLAMVGVMGLVVYPMLDAIVRQQSGNPKAHVARFGLSAIPYDLYKWTRGQESLIHFGVKVFTPAPATYEILQQAFNRDFWSGDQVAPFYDTPLQATEDRIKHLSGTNIPLENFLEGQTVGQGVARQFGVMIPPSRQERIRQSLMEKQDKKRAEHRYFKERRR